MHEFVSLGLGGTPSRELGLGWLPLAPPAPAGFLATPGDAMVSLSWLPAAGADAYTLYWATTPGVTPETGTAISGVTSPHSHTGRTNGQPYYYVVTASNEGFEGEASAEVSATPAAPITAVTHDLIV